MSQKIFREGQTLTITIPRWLGWRTVSLSFSISILVLLVTLFWTGRKDTVDRDRLHTRITDLSRLSTVEYKLSTVVEVINPRGVWGDEVLVYGVCGRAVAGIDLAKLSQEDIQVDGSRIRIELPEAEVFTVDLLGENNMREVPEYKLEAEGRTVEMRSGCADIIDWDIPGPLKATPQLVTDAQEEALKAFKKTAEEKGIKAKAQENAQDLLEKWFNRLDFETVDVVLPEIEESQE